MMNPKIKFICLIAAVSLLFADSQLLSPNFTPEKDDFASLEELSDYFSFPESKNNKPRDLGRRRFEKLPNRYWIDHHQELLGGVIKKGAHKISNSQKLQSRVKTILSSRVAQTDQKLARKIKKLVISNARKYQMDPMLILAVIESESNFNPKLVGGVGEIGLMQILPSTAKWVSELNGWSWKGPQSLYKPEVNIEIGVAFLAMLRKEFDRHGRLYLAAYNMGQRNVWELLERNKWPKDYPVRVMEKYLAYYKSMNRPTLLPKS